MPGSQRRHTCLVGFRACYKALSPALVVFLASFTGLHGQVLEVRAHSMDAFGVAGWLVAAVALAG